LLDALPVPPISNPEFYVLFFLRQELNSRLPFRRQDRSGTNSVFFRLGSSNDGGFHVRRAKIEKVPLRLPTAAAVASAAAKAIDSWELVAQKRKEWTGISL